MGKFYLPRLVLLALVIDPQGSPDVLCIKKRVVIGDSVELYERFGHCKLVGLSGIEPETDL